MVFAPLIPAIMRDRVCLSTISTNPNFLAIPNVPGMYAQKRANVCVMPKVFKTVDVFAGPGGLAEGFSSVRDVDGNRIFKIAVSVEMEASAFSTLRLRSFTRQFESLPDEYYEYVAGKIDKKTLQEKYPEEWKAAENETKMLKLGTEEAKNTLDPILDKLSSETSGDTILIGGPPCQAYSLVGRARNKGIKDYKPEDDHRHFLYKEYIRIIERLKPAAFVMENVKGILSSKVSERGIFELVVSDLQSAGGQPGSYKLIPLVQYKEKHRNENVIRCEDFGIPQNRHRVILLGLRKDIADKCSAGILSEYHLQTSDEKSTVADVLKGLPKLRSGLSKSKDGPEEWRAAAAEAFKQAAEACAGDNSVAKVHKTLLSYASRISASDLLTRFSDTLVKAQDAELSKWLTDPELKVLPNHETRGHMESDLARYAFASVFAELFDRSPKAGEFPVGLAPDHDNWKSGNFADRFKVQCWKSPSSTVTSHISKDGHYFIHPDPAQCRSLTVREAARLQTFPDNYLFEGNRTQQYVQVGNAVPPLLARKIGEVLHKLLISDSNAP